MCVICVYYVCNNMCARSYQYEVYSIEHLKTMCSVTAIKRPVFRLLSRLANSLSDTGKN